MQGDEPEQSTGERAEYGATLVGRAQSGHMHRLIVSIDNRFHLHPFSNPVIRGIINCMHPRHRQDERPYLRHLLEPVRIVFPARWDGGGEEDGQCDSGFATLPLPLILVTSKSSRVDSKPIDMFSFPMASLDQHCLPLSR